MKVKKANGNELVVELEDLSRSRLIAGLASMPGSPILSDLKLLNMRKPT